MNVSRCCLMFTRLLGNSNSRRTKMPVQMIAVQSSNIDSAGYDRARQELYVKFHNDGTRVYRYLKVPPLVWKAFQLADSKKRFVKECVIPYFEFQIVAEGINSGLSTRRMGR